jgi:hypothetical protein
MRITRPLGWAIALLLLNMSHVRNNTSNSQQVCFVYYGVTTTTRENTDINNSERCLVSCRICQRTVVLAKDAFVVGRIKAESATLRAMLNWGQNWGTKVLQQPRREHE